MFFLVFLLFLLSGYVKGCALSYNINSANSFLALNDTQAGFVTTYRVVGGGQVNFSEENGSIIRVLYISAILVRVSTNDPGVLSTPAAQILYMDYSFRNMGSYQQSYGVVMNGGGELADWMLFKPRRLVLRNLFGSLLVTSNGLPLGDTPGRYLQIGTGASTFPADYSVYGLAWDYIYNLNDNGLDSGFIFAGYMRFGLESACSCEEAFPFNNFANNPGIPVDYSVHLRPRHSRDPNKTFFYTVNNAYQTLPQVFGFSKIIAPDPTQTILQIRTWLQPVEVFPPGEGSLMLLDMIFQGSPGNTPGSGYGAPVDGNNPFVVPDWTVIYDQGAPVSDRPSSSSTKSLAGKLLRKVFPFLSLSQISDEFTIADDDSPDKEEDSRPLNFVLSNGKDLPFIVQKSKLSSNANLQIPVIEPYVPPTGPPTPRGRAFNDLPELPAPNFGDDIQFFNFVKGSLSDINNQVLYDVHPLNSSLFPAPGFGENLQGPLLQIGTNANTKFPGYGGWFPFQFRMRNGRLWRLGNLTITIEDPIC